MDTKDTKAHASWFLLGVIVSFVVERFSECGADAKSL
jgi:hypothetical protein